MFSSTWEDHSPRDLGWPPIELPIYEVADPPKEESQRCCESSKVCEHQKRFVFPESINPARYKHAQSPAMERHAPFPKSEDL